MNIVVRWWCMVSFALAFAWSAMAAKPTNVILLIGDGMSLPQRMIAEEFVRKQQGRALAMNHLPYHATTRTCSASSLVTDSAAAATAIACGKKTNNHSLGVDTEGKAAESCAEVAKRSGRRVGIVTTVTINHATPGGFYAHRADRNMNYEIGLDLLASGFDYFAGGGMAGHNDRGNALFKGDIYELWRQQGGKFLREDLDAFRALAPSEQKVWYVASSREMPYAIDVRESDRLPTLAELTRKGLELLENPKGFFLMVEGGKIDYAGHANDLATNVRETLAFSDAVDVALDFQKSHPDTLVVVTGDHETGGMTMGIAATGYALYVERLDGQRCSADMVKAWMSKNRPSEFKELVPVLERDFGFRFDGQGVMALGDGDKASLERAFAHDLELARQGKEDDSRYDANKITRLPAEIKRIMSEKCGIGWTSCSHTALPVITTASGPEADRFSGCIENTDIAKAFKEIFRD